SSSRSRARPTRSPPPGKGKRRWRPGRSGSGWACTPASRSSPTRATSASTSIAPPASPRSGTAARCSSPRRRASWSAPTACARWARPPLRARPAPEGLSQPGAGESPPLRSLNQSNLPVQPTPFVGREKELGEVFALLRDPATRLLTLTGAGGSGKTRLGLQAAAAVVDGYPDGVWWVPLQAVREPERVLSEIRSHLGVNGDIAEPI